MSAMAASLQQPSPSHDLPVVLLAEPCLQDMVSSACPHTVLAACWCCFQVGLPEWTFQPSALQDLWLQAPEPAEDEESDEEGQGDLDWSALLPCYSRSLVPLVDGESAVGGGCCRRLASLLNTHWLQFCEHVCMFQVQAHVTRVQPFGSFPCITCHATSAGGIV